MTQEQAQQQLLNAIDEMPYDPACTNFPEAFFPGHGEQGQRELEGYAKALCDDCPIKQMCAEYGIRFGRFGTWGGLSEVELRHLRKRLGVVLPPLTDAL